MSSEDTEKGNGLFVGVLLPRYGVIAEDPIHDFKRTPVFSCFI